MGSSIFKILVPILDFCSLVKLLLRASFGKKKKIAPNLFYRLLFDASIIRLAFVNP